MTVCLCFSHVSMPLGYSKILLVPSTWGSIILTCLILDLSSRDACKYQSGRGPQTLEVHWTRDSVGVLRKFKDELEVCNKEK